MFRMVEMPQVHYMDLHIGTHHLSIEFRGFSKSLALAFTDSSEEMGGCKELTELQCGTVILYIFSLLDGPSSAVSDYS